MSWILLKKAIGYDFFMDLLLVTPMNKGGTAAKRAPPLSLSVS
jgi:hypothetical protein